jgi:hypothetical protein
MTPSLPPPPTIPNGGNMLQGSLKRIRVQQICHLCKLQATQIHQPLQAQLYLRPGLISRKCKLNNTTGSLRQVQFHPHMVNLSQDTVNK